MDLFRTPESDDCIERTLNLPRIEDYWATVPELRNAVGEMKYGTLGKAVSACLALAHGNADVKRKIL